MRGIFKARADEAGANLKGLPGSYDAGKAKLAADVEKLKADNAPADQVAAAEKGLAAYPKDADAAKAQWTKDAGARRARGAAAAPRRGVPGQGRRRARRVAPELPRARVLPDGRHGGAAAHPDALLHDPVGAPGARIGVLVAVLHLPAVLHGAGARRAREVRRLLVRGRLRVRQIAAVGGVVAEGGPRRCCRSSTSTRTASCSSPRSRSAATSSCWRHRRSRDCRTSYRAWSPRAGWRRRCRPPTGCC